MPLFCARGLLVGLMAITLSALPAIQARGGCFDGIKMGKMNYAGYDEDLPSSTLEGCIAACQAQPLCWFSRFYSDNTCMLRGSPNITNGGQRDTVTVCLPKSNYHPNGALTEPYYCAANQDVMGIEVASIDVLDPSADAQSACAEACTNNPDCQFFYFQWSIMGRSWQQCSLRRDPWSGRPNAIGSTGPAPRSSLCFKTTDFPEPPPEAGSSVEQATGDIFPYNGCMFNVESPYSFTLETVTSNTALKPASDLVCGILASDTVCEPYGCCNVDASQLILHINDHCVGSVYSVRVDGAINPFSIDNAYGIAKSTLTIGDLPQLEIGQRVQICFQLKPPCRTLPTFCFQGQCEFAILNAADTCCPKFNEPSSLGVGP